MRTPAQCDVARPWSPDRPVVINSTISRLVTSAAATSAATRPRYSALIRSLTSLTSFMLWLISSTPRPLSARRRTRSSTCLVCATPRAAVGSSSMTTLEFQSTDFAMATVCRWPPDRLATSWRTRGHRPDRQRGQGVPGLDLHLRLVEHEARFGLAAEEHVLHDVQVVAEREVLVHDLDAQRGRVTRIADRHRLSVEQVLPGVDAVDARDALDQRRLAGAVVTDQSGHLAGIDRQVDVVQHLHRAETLVHPPQFQDRSRSAGSSAAPRIRVRTGVRSTGAGPGRRCDVVRARQNLRSADAGRRAQRGVLAGAQLGALDALRRRRRP